MSSAAGSLPPARRPQTSYTVAMVCLGNICRSPTAEVVLSAKLSAAGLDDQVSVLSFGTGDWHIGGPMDTRAAATLTVAGYDPSRHRARQFDSRWLGRADLVLVMDDDNLRTVNAIKNDGGGSDRVRLFREFDPLHGGALELPDPWFGGIEGFHDVLTIVERTADELLDRLEALLSRGDVA